MTRPIAISLSPNTEADDIRQAWRVLLHPPLWKDEKILQKVSQILAHHFSDRHVALTSSGRGALYEVLKAYGLGVGDEVILQAFTCIAVPAAIKWTRAKPIYADIVADTYNFDAQNVRQKITPKTKAIIIQHTFGLPGPIDEILAIAREHALIIIEDCAHALGARYKGQPLGTFGDAAIVSFGRDKTLSSVFGGAAISKDPLVIQKIQATETAKPLPPSSWIIQQLFHPILFNFIVPTYFTASLGKIALIIFQRAGLLSKAVAAEEKKGAQPDHIHYRFSPALAHLITLQLSKLDRFTQRRQEIAQRYLAAASSSFSLPRISSQALPSWLRFPVYHPRASEIRQRAREQRMLLGDWYNAPLAPKDSDLAAFDYQPGSCPRAEALSKQVINLPTYPLLTDTQVERIIKLINSQ